ncbi:MFS transporter [Fructilactobacillus myrtifloralis]|uniref:MFS transporter n=1 Tax=Fructilactobacillus myrtifloralis TaxID=2940301 RepID=A0ABY5BRY0_9LACO|nr:MFS transporter [Fructilactobacillus myrtifloralis]USS85823.1 MFS transporter [Fructilactobacillus myrtifloralis]
MKPLTRWLFIATMLVGTFTMSISQSSLSTAYPTLMKYFLISADTVQWLTTGFMIVMCITMPISPWLLNNISFKQLFMGALLLFDLGTLIIFWGPNFYMVMLGRIMEAAAVGVLFPSYQTVLLEITPEQKRGTIMGVAGLVMGSALACGPIISGIVLRYTSWRGLFIFFMVVITLVLLISLFVMRDVMPRVPSKLDWVSVFYSLGLIGLLYVITKAGQPGAEWPVLLVILALSILLLVFFVRRQLTVANPMLDLWVMKSFNYDLSVLLTGFSYISLIVVTIIFPLYYQQVLGASPFVSGMALVPGAALLSLLNPLTGTLADKIGFKPTMLVGMTMIVVGWGILAMVPIFNIWGMIGIAMLIEGGNAFVMMPAVTLGANSLPNQLVSHGTAVITTVRQVLGSTGVAVATLILVNLTGHAIEHGAGLHAANQLGFHAVYWTFFGVAIVGFVIATLIRSTQPNDAN